MVTPQDRTGAETGVGVGTGAIDHLFDPPRAQGRGGSSGQARRSRRSVRGAGLPPPPSESDAATVPSTSTSNSYGAYDSQTEGRWSLGEADGVREWFRQTYNRELPVTAEGQSRTHNRMGLDHSDSLDVGLNPTSDEGKALREYLRARGVPFLAYDRAVPGAATSAHIHIGFPSHRGEAGEAARLGSIEHLFDAGADPLGHLFDKGDAPAASSVGSAAPTSPVSEDYGEYGEPVKINATGGGDDATADKIPVPSMPALPSTPLDVQTQDGRAARDAGKAIEADPHGRKWIDIRLPNGVRDWSELTSHQVAAAGVRQWAAEKGIDPGFTEEWLKKNGGDLFMYDLSNGKFLTTGDAMGHTDETGAQDIYDLNKRTFRLAAEMPQLHKLEEEYKSWRSVAARVGDWVTSAQESPGEKLLDALVPAAGAVGKIGSVAARPFQAASAGVFAGLRGENPLTEAAHTFTTGEHSDRGANPLGSFLRDSQTLNNINPRLGALLGGGADLILDPGNLLAFGLAGKAAKALAGAGRLGRAAEEVGAVGRALGLLERGIVNARPLGLAEETEELSGAVQKGAEVAQAAQAATSAQAGGDVAALEGRLQRVSETARKLRMGEALTPAEEALYAEVRAKHALGATNTNMPGVSEDFDVEMLTADGRRLLSSSKTGEVLDPSTGEIVNLEAEPSPAVRSEQAQYARERAGYYAREAAQATDEVAQQNALALANEYAQEVVRLEGGAAPGELAGAGESAGASSSVSDILTTGPKKPLLRRVLSTTADIISLPKAKAGFDLSATGRQGLPQILARPSFFREAMREQVKAFVSQDSFAAFVKDIKLRPDYELMQQSKLFLSSPGGEHEEAFVSGLARRIPGIKASDRAYSAALDSVRLQAWDLYTSQLGQGATRETYEAVADLINVTTGRGRVPFLDRTELGKKIINALNVPFFSPRTMASRFNIISPVRLIRNVLTPATRPVAYIQMREGFRALATVTTTLGLLDLVTGVDVGWNPFKAEFGKVRIGTAVYDPSGGEAHAVRYMAQLARSFYEAARGREGGWRKRPEELTARYLRSQLSPSAGVAVDATLGTTFEGKPFKPSQAVADLVVPFVVDDAYKAWQDAGGSSFEDLVSAAHTGDGSQLRTAFGGAARAIPSVFGAGTSFYEKMPEQGQGGGYSSEGEPLPELSGEAKAHNAQVDAAMTRLRIKVYDEPRLTPTQRRVLMTRLGRLVRGAAEFKAGQAEDADLPQLQKNLGDATNEIEHDWSDIVNGVRQPSPSTSPTATPSNSPAPGVSPGLPPPPSIQNQNQDQSANHLQLPNGRSELHTEGLRESSNVEDQRESVANEIRRAGQTPVTETQAADVALLVDGLDDHRFAEFAHNLDEHFNSGVLRPLESAAITASEYGAKGLAVLGTSHLSDYQNLSEVARALRLLAEERAKRPLQFKRDALAGRYGEKIRAEMDEGIYYPDNHGPFSSSPGRP